MTGEGERRDAIKDFSFDFSYWSADERSRHYVPQEKVSFSENRLHIVTNGPTT